MSNWKEIDNSLEKSYKFDDFKSAMAFMVAVSYECEAAGHHPEWTNVYDRISVKLNTHDADNTVTEKDRKLAKKMDEVYKRLFA